MPETDALAAHRAAPTIDRAAGDVVLIVDDVPDNLSVLHDALDESGYTVLVATHGEAALARAAQALPDIVLLDAVMPGMDGFEVARRLKADPITAQIPVVFMTGLTDTEHVVQAFAAGGVDYVTKPVRTREVIARIAVHLQGAREKRQARNALDAFGHATLVVRASNGAVVWGTPLARSLLAAHGLGGEGRVAEPMRAWVQREAARREQGEVAPPWTLAREGRQLSLALHEDTGEGQWLVVLQERSDQAAFERLALALNLTLREAEVLYWVTKGKTNRDIGDILQLSPRTVHKHLEHVFEKLAVETRTAAAALAMNCLARHAAPVAR